MENTKKLEFEAPNFFKRLKTMLSVDFYRLFHTPLFYIFIAIAAIIPAMIIGTTGMESSQTGMLFTNTWQAIAVEKPLYVIENIGQYANMNMVFIFGGIMVSIFIGHDYKSGYVKQLFTTHAKKTRLYDVKITCLCVCNGLYVWNIFFGNSSCRNACRAFIQS